MKTTQYPSSNSSLNRELKTLRYQSVVASLLLSVAVLAGCGGDPKGTLTLTGQPGDTVAGKEFTLAVAVQDEKGAPVPGAKGDVQLSLVNAPAGASLSGGTRQPVVNGLAVFSGLSLTKVGEGLAIKATRDGQEAVSRSFKVGPGAAAAVLLSGGPTASTEVSAGQELPALQVSLADAHGNAVASASGEVTVTLVDTGNTGAVLGGTRTATLANAKATFSDLTVDRPGDYTLSVAGGTLTGAKTAAFNVKNGALRFAVQPAASAIAGASLGTVKVEARSTADKVDTKAQGEVTLSLGNANGAQLEGTLTAPLVSGVATFSGLSVKRAGTGYTLQASTPRRVSATSTAFDVEAAAAVSATLASAPAAAVAGEAFAPVVTASVVDAFGNPASGTVQLSLASGPAGAQLVGTLSRASSNGVASFTGVSARVAGSYTLQVALGAGAPSVGSAFTVAPAAASELLSTGGPTAEVIVGRPFGAAFTLRDAFGNLATTDTRTLALSLAGGTAGATLGGTVSAAAAGGQVRFDDLTVSAVGSNYTLHAVLGDSGSAGSLSVDSAAFSAVAAGLAYTAPTTGRVRLVRNAASTASNLVLDLVAQTDVTGFGVGYNLPVTASAVRLAGFTPGTVLDPGAAPRAALAKLSETGPLAGTIIAVQSQKAGGSGAVQGDTLIPAGTVLFSVTLGLQPGAVPSTVVFDGASLAASTAFDAALRDHAGNTVVGRGDFGIGKLEVLGAP